MKDEYTFVTLDDNAVMGDYVFVDMDDSVGMEADFVQIDDSYGNNGTVDDCSSFIVLDDVEMFGDIDIASSMNEADISIIL